MSKRFLVNWSDIGIEGAETFGAKSAHAAYLDFIDENVQRSVPVSVWSDDGTGDYEEFEEHFDSESMTKLAKKRCTELGDRLKSSGFTALNKDEVSFICQILERSLLEPQSVSEEEFNLSKVILKDDSAFRFFSLRTNTLSTLQQQAILKEMNVNLSNISSKTSGVRMASGFMGMVAARNLGEELAADDDVGEEFDGGDF
jgi:hypothetical protein